MRLPHDVSGQQLADSLSVLGYAVTHQRGDHLRLTTQQEGEHHVSIPLHAPLRIGPFAGILSDAGAHFSLSRDALLQQLDL
jgi:predicted RNA binding protein YcfA (HicA-like mRNA interferase family)